MAQLLKYASQLSLPSVAEIKAGFRAWIKKNGPFWAASVAGHVVVLLALGLVLGTAKVAQIVMEAPIFETEVETALPEPDLTRFEVGEAPVEPTVLDTESLSLNEAPQMEQTAQFNDDSAIFEEAGGGTVSNATASLSGLGGFDINAIGAGPAVKGAGGVGTGVGTSTNAGSGGAGVGFGGRGSGMRQAMVASFGGTRQTERAVASGLNWIARHQNADGSWSLHDFSRNCKGGTCGGHGDVQSNAAATAFALLPFLAAGQTHESKGPYQKTIRDGLLWLVKNQKPDGSLAAGSSQIMYTHGLASIVMCEAYGLSRDKTLGASAQGAIKFIEAAQFTNGSWGYSPGTDGDTSVVGWQVMAMKSAQMAGLKVNQPTLERAKQYLKACSSGAAGGLYGYKPGGGGSPTLTAVGLLCTQYMGAKRTDPAMVEGMKYIMANLPDLNARNCYYWYYAMQVMHNLPGPEWDVFNRHARRMLVETQVKEGCAAGSWDPDKPTKDAWGQQGGRLMVTSIACLSLEVYYRYLPLYQLDSKSTLKTDLISTDKGKEKTPPAKADPPAATPPEKK